MITIEKSYDEIRRQILSGKRIVLHGESKIEKDFIYLFLGLKIEIENTYSKNDIHIICDGKKNISLETRFQQAGLVHGADYIYIRDFFRFYNPLILERGNRKLAVWGTGKAASDLWQVLEERGFSSEIDFYIDNAQDKKIFKGKRVCAPTEVKDRDDLYIIVATYEYQWEIYSQLEEYGFLSRKDFIHCTVVMEDYSMLLEQVCFSEAKYSHVCYRPFGYCDLIGEDLFLCCPDFLSPSAGSMKYESFMNCWDSYRARILRLSVINGTFVFCNKEYCDLFDFIPSAQVENKSTGELKCSNCPNTLMIGIDYSCNLHCPSCRKRVCVASQEERKEINRVAVDLLENVVPYVERLWIAGSGEVFFSPTYKKILLDERCQKRECVSILSNGTLFDKKVWMQLEKAYHNVEVVISMDGIKDETIEKLRKGANAKKLKTNLKSLGKLRKEGKIRFLFISCVLQKANIAEIYELLEYCAEIGVDKVQFLKLKNNGIFRDQEKFKEMSVFDEKGEVKEKYRKFFTKELLEHPLADWFNNTKALGVNKKKRLDEFDTF